MGANKRTTYSQIVKKYINMLSPVLLYYILAALLYQFHLRMRLSRGFPGKPSSFTVESSKLQYKCTVRSLETFFQQYVQLMTTNTIFIQLQITSNMILFNKSLYKNNQVLEVLGGTYNLMSTIHFSVISKHLFFFYDVSFFLLLYA